MNVLPVLHMKKCADWKYENKIRFIMRNRNDKRMSEDDRRFSLNEGIIRQVILGCKMEAKDMVEIVGIFEKKSQNIELLRAVQSKDRFSLDFEKIPY